MITLAAVPVAFLGVMASAPSASAAVPGNCPEDTVCVWSNWWYGDTDVPPSLATESEWSGSVPGRQFYNNTARDITMTYVLVQDEGRGPVHTACVNRKQGSYFTVPVSVTKVTWEETTGRC
ncbi:hypothetical protein CUT44_05030 [Streptomyces carminius]|uniref:Peptidase inhibitor family I36 protein n=1 Tax=Streptomyces carminius TaxID=2665496 RepID=A0A2M8M5C7_9ACTN|nr:hypothetical protein CUT44_05030 [Streptomyces carminius]